MRLTAEERSQLLDVVEKVLPHGSGIDYDWQIDVKENGNITCKNAYHRMDENGFYDGIFPFTVRFWLPTAKRKYGISLHFNGLNSWGQRVARSEMLKDYLETVCFEYDIVVLTELFELEQKHARKQNYKNIMG